MCEERHHIEIEPGCVATFNTPTPHPETIRILRDVIRMAMAVEDRRVRDSSGGEAGPEGTEPNKTVS